MSPRRPQLVQFPGLRPSHFASHPVWVQCHGLDDGEKWYDDTDEETFRPWTGPLPVDPAATLFLVQATLTFHDGTREPGFVTPQAAGEPEDMGRMQPSLWLPNGKLEGFWSGTIGRPPTERRKFYAAFGKKADQVFPASCATRPGLTRGRSSISIAGFYYSPDSKKVIVET
jgi:hypothetical protein